jgi:aspartate aminotransferase
MMQQRFSRRVLDVEMSGIRKFFQAARPDSINLGLGQPDFDTPAHIKEAAIRAIRDGRTGYTFNTGIEELRTALCDKLRRENNLEYAPDQVIVTAGAGEALFIALQSLVENGDRVLVPDPGFVSYAAGAVLAGGRPVGVPLDDSLHLDIEACKELMDGARLFILNSPANPTGAVESRETIRAIVEYAGDAGVTVVSDEVYEHFIYEKEHVSAACFGDDVVTVNAASKTYAMTGWRLGYVAASREYIAQFVKVHQYCQTCATSISQYAALAAYTGDQSCVAEMRAEYGERRRLLSEGLREIGIPFPEPEGAFYAFVPMEQQLITRILDGGVILVPGDAFGDNGKGYARLSYAASRRDITEALRRIAKATE